MKTRPKQRKSASNQSSIIQGFQKNINPIQPKILSLNELRQKNIQDILDKIKK